jgi:hypothetical protein
MIKHKHHIIPRHAGGSDDPSNLIEVTIEEHAKLHYDRYLEMGNLYDLGAYHLLNGQTDESWKLMCSMGGQTQGKRNAESGHIQNIQSLQDHSTNGKKGAAVCKELGVNSFFDPELRKTACSNGGKKGGRTNAESGHCKLISVQYWENVRNGKVIRIKKSWYYNTSNNHSILIKEGDCIPEGYLKGRKNK